MQYYFSAYIYYSNHCCKTGFQRPCFLLRQERVGKDKKLFHILKFRTMKVDTPKEDSPPVCWKIRSNI